MMLASTKICLLIFVGLALQCNSKKSPVEKLRELFKILDEEIPAECCLDQDLKLCQVAAVHTELLSEKQGDILVLGKTLTFEDYIPPNGLVYSDQSGKQAIIR